MRAINILTIVIFYFLQTLLLTGCKKESSPFLNTYIISNPSGFDLVALNKNTKQRIEIKDGATVTILSNEQIDFFDIIGNDGMDRKYMLEDKSRGKYTVYSYEFELEYRCSGTSSIAKLSFLDDQGKDKIVPKVILPYSVGYKIYKQKTYKLDIENLDATGFVTIDVIYKGKMLKPSLSAPFRASSSGIIDN